MTNSYEYELSDLIPLVSELVEKYTSKESSSVPYETAKQLMEAVEYCIQENRKVDESLLDHETAALMRINDHCPAKDAYERGYKIVLSKVHAIRKIYHSMADNFQSYGNENYYDTVMKGIPGFLTHYDARFNPQNEILTMDYPLLSSLDEGCGVDIILVYLREIELEQRFLRRWPAQMIEAILTRYHSDYETMFFNVCYPVFAHMMCCMIAGKNVTEVEWTQEEYERIEEYVLSHKRSKVHKELNEKLHQALEYQTRDSEKLYQYLQNGLSELITQMFNAVQNDCVETIFYQG